MRILKVLALYAAMWSVVIANAHLPSPEAGHPRWHAAQFAILGLIGVVMAVVVADER